MKRQELQSAVGFTARVADALDRLVELYSAWGKPDQAAAWRREQSALSKP
jgi:hypothetical protein